MNPEIWHEFVTSYAAAVERLNVRVSKGIQPQLPLMNLPFLLGANAVYFLVTLVIFLYMRQQANGFKLKGLIALYNCICIILAGAVVLGVIYVKIIYNRPAQFACNPAEDTDEFSQVLANVFWLFYIQKFWEFFDTWFFILRKSFRQVTLLHLYHHSSITFIIGLQTPYCFSGDVYLPVLLNSIVHVLMYSYYLVTTLELKNSFVLKLKPYLTSLQLIQFLLIAAQNVVTVLEGPSCGYPYFIKFSMLLYMASMLVMFGNFFWQTYVAKVPSKKLQ